MAMWAVWDGHQDSARSHRSETLLTGMGSIKDIVETMESRGFKDHIRVEYRTLEIGSRNYNSGIVRARRDSSKDEGEGHIPSRRVESKHCLLRKLAMLWKKL